eukprot:scaffold66008_cov33-Tisochrysis_lutea.AAC.6
MDERRDRSREGSSSRRHPPPLPHESGVGWVGKDCRSVAHHSKLQPGGRTSSQIAAHESICTPVVAIPVAPTDHRMSVRQRHNHPHGPTRAVRQRRRRPSTWHVSRRARRKLMRCAGRMLIGSEGSTEEGSYVIPLTILNLQRLLA